MIAPSSKESLYTNSSWSVNREIVLVVERPCRNGSYGKMIVCNELVLPHPSHLFYLFALEFISLSLQNQCISLLGEWPTFFESYLYCITTAFFLTLKNSSKSALTKLTSHLIVIHLLPNRKFIVLNVGCLSLIGRSWSRMWRNS